MNATEIRIPYAVTLMAVMDWSADSKLETALLIAAHLDNPNLELLKGHIEDLLNDPTYSQELKSQFSDLCQKDLEFLE